MTRFRWLGFDSSRKLSTEEAVELAARVAELTKSGLPLGAGLRALAGELPGRRLPHVLRSMADRLDRGADLPAAIEAEGRRLPTCLRGLVLAGIRSGRLAEVLEEYVDLQRSRLDLRPIWLSLVYPFVLLTTMAAIAVFMRLHFVTPFERIFQDFGAQVPALTEFALKIWGPVVLCLVGLLSLPAAVQVMLWLGRGVSWVWPVLHRVPMVGPLLCWSHLAHFSRVMSLLLEQQVPLPDALRMTATALPDANLAQGCRCAADDVDRGRLLDESLSSRRQFPASLIPLVEWGRQANALPDAFHAAAEMFEGRARSHRVSLEAMLLPTWFLMGAVISGVFIVFFMAMFWPLLAFMQLLT